MGASISFRNLEDAWLYRRGVFDLILYHSVIRHSSREKLPNLFPDVERECNEYLGWVEPATYPPGEGSLGLIVFDEYPAEERREFLRAVRKGVEEIRSVTSDSQFRWDFKRKDIYVEVGEELIDLMEKSLAKSEGEQESVKEQADTP